MQVVFVLDMPQYPEELHTNYYNYFMYYQFTLIPLTCLKHI